MLQTLTFQAGGRLINAQAQFFRYESSAASGGDDSIKVRADGQDLGVYYPGDSIDLPAPATTWELTPSSPTCTGVVRVGMGRVQSARLAGVVAITDMVSPAIQQLNANDTPVATGFQVPRVVVPPANNVRGVKVRGFASNVTAGAGGAVDCRIIAAPSMPAQLSPLNSYLLGGAAAVSGGSQALASRQLNITIPTGWGLYVVVNSNVSVPVQVLNDINLEVL